MPKAKNRRKNGKVKKYKGPTLRKVTVLKKQPYCMHCNTPTKLATSTELLEVKAYDPTFNESFLFLPQCECWVDNKEWMTV